MPNSSRLITPLLLLAMLGCGDSGDASASGAPAPTTAKPAVEPQPQTHPGAQAERALRGTIDIDPLLGLETGQHACVYLMGWRGLRQGPPQIVRKLTTTKMPVSFSMDARDLAAAGTIAGDWILVARLDGDSDAAPEEGDLQGEARGFVTADGPPARIFLTKRLTVEDARHAKLIAEAVAAAGAPPATPVPKTGPRIKGTISLAEEFGDMNGTRTLFVILKDKALPRGMPRAVMMVNQPQFPVTFDMGVEHIPLEVDNKEDLLAGQLYLTARLDDDGSFMGAPGDIELAAPLPVTADGKPVKLVLDTRRKN
jgi:hypothetical protein